MTNEYLVQQLKRFNLKSGEILDFIDYCEK